MEASERIYSASHLGLLQKRLCTLKPDTATEPLSGVMAKDHRARHLRPSASAIRVWYHLGFSWYHYA